MASALARRRLLLDRTDDRDLQPGDRHARGTDERSERTLRVHGAATDELAVLDANRYLARDGVDVSEQYDVTGAVADLTDRVARVIDGRAEPTLAHAREEPLDGVAFLTGHARDLD